MKIGKGMEDLNIDEIIGGFHFRRVAPQDKELFMAMRAETDEVREYYRRYPAFMDYTWGSILKAENELGIVVFQHPDDLFVGICSFQGLQNDTIELGYDVVEELRGKGIGSGMVGALFVLARKVFPDCEIFIRIKKDNKASCRVAEKNGAQFVKDEDPPEVETLKRLLAENKHLPNEAKARAVLEHSKNTIRVYKV